MQALSTYYLTDFVITGISKKGCVICSTNSMGEYSKTVFITNKIYNRLLREGSLTGCVSKNSGQYEGTYTLKVLSAF